MIFEQPDPWQKSLHSETFVNIESDLIRMERWLNEVKFANGTTLDVMKRLSSGSVSSTAPAYDLCDWYPWVIHKPVA